MFSSTLFPQVRAATPRLPVYHACSHGSWFIAQAGLLQQNPTALEELSEVMQDASDMGDLQNAFLVITGLTLMVLLARLLTLLHFQPRIGLVCHA